MSETYIGVKKPGNQNRLSSQVQQPIVILSETKNLVSAGVKKPGNQNPLPLRVQPPIVILSETKNLLYIGVKNAGVHFTVTPGEPKVTSTVAGIPTG